MCPAMNFDDTKVEITGPCDCCGKTLAVPYKWNMGTIIPCANQIRLAILEWSPKTRELNEVTLTPDISVLVLCDPCKEELLNEFMATVMKLQAKRPAVKVEGARVN